jgi:hypothetical protein
MFVRCHDASVTKEPRKKRGRESFFRSSGHAPKTRPILRILRAKLSKRKPSPTDMALDLYSFRLSSTPPLIDSAGLLKRASNGFLDETLSPLTNPCPLGR